jgi:capsular polysaccharide biosynthesis protein
MVTIRYYLGFFGIKFIINLFINLFSFKLLKVKRYNEFKYKDEKVLENKAKIRYLTPKFWNKAPKKITNKKIIYFPKISFLTFKKVSVYGASSFIFKDDFLIHHDLFDPIKNYCLEELQGKCWFFKNSKVLWRKRKINYNIDEAISFLDSSSFNYAHWLTEILPRIYLFRKYYNKKKIILLIDKNIHKNLLQSLKIILTDTNVIIKQVKKNHCILVNKLHTITPVGFSNHTPKKIAYKHSHGLFNQNILKEMSDFILKKVPINKNYNYKKILLSRDQDIRNVKNTKLFNSLLINLGYKKILLKNLDFLSQVQIFNNTKDIITISGASVSNMLFSKKRTRLLLIVTFKKNGPGLYYYPSMLGNKKIDLHYIFAKMNLPFLVHANLNLDFNILKNFYKRYTT